MKNMVWVLNFQAQKVDLLLKKKPVTIKLQAFLLELLKVEILK